MTEAVEGRAHEDDRSELDGGVDPNVDAEVPVSPTVGAGSRATRRVIVWALLSRGLAAGATFLVTVVLARELGVDAFGSTTVVISVAVFGAFAVSGGTNRSSLREVSAALAVGDEARAARALHDTARIMRWSTPIGGLLAFVTVSALTWSTGDGLALGLVGAVVAILLGITLVLADVLRALGETRLSSLLAGRSGGALVQIVLIGVLLIARYAGLTTAVEALALYALAVLLATIPCAVVFFRWRRSLLGSVPRASGPSAVHLRNSLPFLFNQMALLVNGQVDLWTASVLLSETDVGLYSAGLRPVTVVSLPLQAAELVMTPRIAALHAKGDRERMEREARTSATYVTLGSLVLLLPLLVAPELLITVAFGSAFAPAAPVLRILALGQFCNAFTGQCNAVLAMTGHERLVVSMSIAGVVASLVAGIVGAVLGGPVGLAIGASLSTAVLWFIMWGLARKVTGLWTHASWRYLTPAR